MTSRTAFAVAASLAVGAAVAGPAARLVDSDGEARATAVAPTDPGPTDPGAADVGRHIERFLDSYVDDDGRVVRRDEGHDTVSEGQAYAMVAAVGVGDRQRFAATWEWAKAHIMRPDGLLSWRWADGEIVDRAAAADADVLAAWALFEAADRFGRSEYRIDAERLAAAVLAHETVLVGDEALLVAGPWAQHSTPVFVNPGYFAPQVFAALAVHTGDATWLELAATSRDVTAQLVADGNLVPDWARVADTGTARAHGGPESDDAPGAFGLDAARLYVWLASSCDERDHALAATAWRFFEAEAPGGIALRYGLDGERLTDHQHPLTWVAAAASALAYGEDHHGLLARAAEFEREYPSYYGSAWVALGYLLLATDWLYEC